MGVADSGAFDGGQAAPDLVVAGAGVAGLWLTVKAARAGLKVMLVEKDTPGAGASGGFLGALMPHGPERWNDKKEFQLRALIDLEDEVARLESETGFRCLYRRSGRILPLSSERARTEALSREADARANWGPRFAWEVRHAADLGGWPDMLRAPHGVVHETLSARVSPPGLLGALLASLGAMPGVDLRVGVAVTGILSEGRAVRLSDGSTVACGQVALANGVGAFPLVAHTARLQGHRLGSGVKGQAALLDAGAPPDLPLVFDDGVYVIVHESGAVAIGSTSERDYDDPSTTDLQLDDLVARARKLCPLIKHAPVLRRWAGVRPRGVAPDPMLGPVPGAPNVLAMAGGFKITFGIAHRMADCVVAGITGHAGPDMPESFTVAHHIAKAGKAARPAAEG